MLFLVLVTSTKHYWVISAERRRSVRPNVLTESECAIFLLRTSVLLTSVLSYFLLFLLKVGGTGLAKR
jgi:hypothetical protein